MSLHGVLRPSCHIFLGKRILGRPPVGSRRTSLSTFKRRCTECGSSARCTVAPHLRIASEKVNPSVSRRSERISAGRRPSFCRASHLHRWRHFWRHGGFWWVWRLGPSGPNFFRRKVSECLLTHSRHSIGAGNQECSALEAYLVWSGPSTTLQAFQGKMTSVDQKLVPALCTSYEQFCEVFNAARAPKLPRSEILISPNERFLNTMKCMIS